MFYAGPAPPGRTARHGRVTLFSMSSLGNFCRRAILRAEPPRSTSRSISASAPATSAGASSTTPSARAMHDQFLRALFAHGFNLSSPRASPTEPHAALDLSRQAPRPRQGGSRSTSCLRRHAAPRRRDHHDTRCASSSSPRPPRGVQLRPLSALTPQTRSPSWWTRSTRPTQCLSDLSGAMLAI